MMVVFYNVLKWLGLLGAAGRRLDPDRQHPGDVRDGARAGGVLVDLDRRRRGRRAAAAQGRVLPERGALPGLWRVLRGRLPHLGGGRARLAAVPGRARESMDAEVPMSDAERCGSTRSSARSTTSGRPGGDRGRRRGPRERRRHRLRGEQGDAGPGRLHDPLLQRRDLRADGGPALDRLGDPADDAAQPRTAAHGVHDLGRRPRRRHDGHLGGRPRAHDPGARRLGDRAVRDRPAGPRVPAALPRGRRAGAARAHRGSRSTWPGWPG